MSSVAIERASSADHSLIANLLELYMHDMSEYFPLTLNPEGRFGYDRLSLYWSQPDSHRAYVIRSDDEIAGCALVARGSLASRDPNVLDLNEFFILRSHRRQRVGERAATLIWDQQPGRWVVRIAETNHRALSFWDATIRQYAGTAFSTSKLPGKSLQFSVYEFASRGL